MKKPRLLHLFNAFQVGGVERQHMMLVECLSKDYDQTCWSYCHGPLENELDALGVTHRVGGVEVVAAMLANERISCVVMRTNRYLDDICSLLSQSDRPVVYMKDYLRWFDGNMSYIDPIRDARAASIANAAFYCGPSLASAFKNFQGVCGKAELMYNGLNLSKLPLSHGKYYKNNHLRVGIIGNICQRKNQLAAIESLKSDLLAGTLSLELAGATAEPLYAKRLHRASKGLPVTLHGYVADPIDFLSKIDVFLLTSTLEGWPVSIMEAMACGVPVVAPDVGDIKKLLDYGQAGKIYPAGEYQRIPALMEELNDPVYFENVSHQGLKQVEKFDINIAWQQLATALNTLIPS